MGAFASRRNSGVQTVDIPNENAYRYPPKSGSYFGSYFMMGGERFDMTPPEAYLFGDNSDLNFLGSKPVPFPYTVTHSNEPTKTLKSLVYIRKDSLRFVKTALAEKTPPEEDKEKQPVATKYNIEFTFDADANCAITIYYFAKEETSNGQIVYRPSTGLRSETYHYKRGANQLFSQPAHSICPSDYNEVDWQYTFEREIIPITIHCVVEEEDYIGHSHVTYAVVEKSSDGGFMLKPLKQKQFVDGLSYLLQEIYGIENKNVDREKIDPDDDPDDSGAECVICMGERRDTLILPCRHLCLCSNCAESLRYQCSFCPICRSAFRALLQLRAMRKKPLIPQPQQGGEGEENLVSQEGVPPGFEAMSLIEALNGPCGGAPYPPPENHVPVRFVPTFDSETTALEKRKTNKKHTSPGHKRRHKAITDDNLDHSDDKTKDKPEEENKRVEVVDYVRSPEEDNKRNNIILVRYPSYKGSPTSPKIPSGEEADGEETENCMEDGFEAKDIPVLAESPRRFRSSRDSNSKEEFLKLYEVAEEEVANETTEPTKIEIPKPDYDEAIPVGAVKRVIETVERIERAASGFPRPVDEFGKLASGISSGHMADDELEDTTDGEPERDSDYEGHTAKNTEVAPDLSCVCDETEETDYAPQSGETTVDGYQALQLTTASDILSENAGSNTENSGASSAGSSQNLLPYTLTDIDIDDEK